MSQPEDIVNAVFVGKVSLIHRPAMVHLCTMAQNAPPGVAVELGVYRGSSLAALCLAREGMGEVIGVDDWSYPDPPDLHGKTLEKLKWHNVTPTLLSMTTHNAALIVAPPLAFVHIDANHTLEYVREDIAMWAPKIMSGGVIAFHDYGRNRDDIQVKQAVDEWQKRDPWFCLGEVMTTIGYRKP